MFRYGTYTLTLQLIGDALTVSAAMYVCGGFDGGLLMACRRSQEVSELCS